MSTIIPTTRDHVTSDEAMYDVRASHWTRREVSDATALTIASWWQSPSTVGHVLASLAGGMAVDVTDLLDDIRATRNRVLDGTDDKLALDMLATWAINHPSRQD